MQAKQKSKNETTMRTILCGFALLASFGCGKAATPGSSTDDVKDSGASPWSAAVQSSYEGNAALLATMSNNSCVVESPDSLYRHEALRVVVTSKGIKEVQVSADKAPWSDLGAVNGVLTWAGNSFVPSTYNIRFRGIKTSDGLPVDCSPAEKTIVLHPSSQSNSAVVLSEEVKKTYTSWHQSALRIATPPAAGSYTYQFIYPTGFKNQFDPNNSVTSCAMGYVKNSDCAFPGGLSDGSLTMSFSENYNLYQVPENIRFFVPSGTKEVRLVGYAQQKTAFAFVMRMGQPPTRSAPVGAAEYSQIQVSEKVDTSFQRLVNGEEILVVHDGGGTLRMLSGRISATSGGWVFVRQLEISQPVSGLTTGETLYQLQGGMDVEKTAFTSQYNQIKWDTNGDPQ